MAAQWSCGHTNSVLSLAVSTDKVVASGAEAGELAIWNYQGLHLDTLHLDGGGDVTGITFSPVCSTRLYVSHGETLSVLDTRSFKDPVENFSVNKEEINCISVNETGNLLAAADDSGAIKVLDLENKKVCRTLQRHTNICSAVSFRPHRPQSLVSCGLDMQVMLWNMHKTRPLWITNLQQLAEEENDVNHHKSPGQLFNPPLAHSVAVAPCGNIFSCGAEDGKIRIFRVTGSRFESDLCFKGHTQGVSQVSFIDQNDGLPWLISAGNDGKVCLWDIGKETAPQQKPQPPKHVRKNGHVHSKTKNAVHQTKDTSSRVTARLSIEHGEKVNWIVGAELQGSQVVLIADPSITISVYQLGEI
ncbi:WD repeat-containing protein 53 [Bombina bombina]|uniref:WD repeat-containing protein 53 n=1 Tax=Bombina bombina TaxID=8345 RepID=UPI00235A95D1|nr:WD repeat-containing protein 53 [Bombina bombina]XP_053564939.1 WD repeat-containing protein 53 [Bombina bombina]